MTSPLSPASKGKLVLIIGPSGVGKSVILQRLRRAHRQIHFPRSATTRARRPRESDDLYRFVTDEEFEMLVQQKKLLEWATVHGGARYGTLINEIFPPIEAGKTVLREVDVQGFDHIRGNPLFAGADPRYRLVSIFILPESKEQLIAHITKRAPIGKEELARRVTSMEHELAYAELCTAQVKNLEGKMQDTLKKVEKIILQQ
jgi:guanylate kinase